jgi:hypothetical protein
MATVELDKGISIEGLEFLRDYPANFGFFVYGTYSGNRCSIEVYYTPDEELKKYGPWRRRHPSGFELILGEVHLVLAYKSRGDPKPKIDRLVRDAPIYEKVARKYGYPFDGLWSVGGWKEDKAKLRKKMIEELKAELKKKGSI